MAPPTKATAELLVALREMLDLGATLKVAAEHAGISVRTLHRWVKRGARHEGAAFELAREIVHEARRDLPVVAVRTPKGLALRRGRVRRPGLATIVRQMEKALRKREEMKG